MKRSVLLLIAIIYGFGAVARNLERVMLSDYGGLSVESLQGTLNIAIDDIEGKRLILPSLPLDIDNVEIKNKSNFEIVGDTSFAITCRNFMIRDCNDFELRGLYIRGTKEKFSTFYIMGDCSDFRINDCLFDSDKGKDGHNTFYGIHIITDYQNKNSNFSNSPRKFRIDHNIVRNTRYDGILAHAYCSDFVIEKNTVIGAECIGIEVEGRLGDNKHTTVHPCKNAIVRNNYMMNCGGWGILLMWTNHVKVYNNKSFNAGGAFLSIGCKDLTVKRNIFEGNRLGFEISQEYYKVENGINEKVRIMNNVIKGRARGDNRGALDIRHSRNVVVNHNTITALYRDKSAYVSLASCQQITLRNNTFTYENNPLKDIIYKTNVPSPETGRSVPELDWKDLKIQEIKIKY